VNRCRSGGDRVHGSEASGSARKFCQFLHNLGFSDR
jgi:hypothetical protein